MTAIAGRIDVVDIDVDPLVERSRRRRTLLRIGLPLGGVGLIIGFLLGIGLYADAANRAGVLGLSNTLLHDLQQRIELEVEAYLQPAAHAALLAHSMLGRGGATNRADEAYAFARSVLNETPAVANVLFSDGAGNFMLVRRATDEKAPPSATETKRILQFQGSRSVEWITRDKSGLVIARRQDPADDYDARTRSWFIGARAIDEVFWSGVYIFFSERAPGVTAAAHGPDADPDVVGIDIRLDAMSRFLGALSIGKTGRAYIVAKTGEMIAGPDPTHILHDRDGKLAPAKVAEVGDANLTASWDHYRVEGAGTRVIDLQGERLISIATPLISNGEDWLLVISVPEAEFSGFVSVNSRRAALLSLVVAALAIGLAALLVRQGLRTDRADRAVAERSEAVRQQSNAFARLALEAGQFEPDGTPPKALIETLAEATGARRAGLWRLLAGGHVLRCEDSFEPASGGHTAGVELSRQEVPAFIAALVAGEEIDAPDARRDRRTSALHGSLMAPFGTSAVFAVPVMQAATRTRIVLGLLLLEDARRDPAARDIARACATLVALRAPAELPAAAIVPATAASPTEQPGDDHGLDTALGPAPKDLAVATYARASVMVLRLPELAMARAAAEDASGPPLAHRVACAARDIAALHAIPYVKMLGATVVAASGHAATSSAAATDAALRLADTAIALREVCANLFGSEDAAEFGIGLDAGLVLGGMLGATDDPAAANGGLFNLWGDAVRNADAMAASAPAGGIQASERAYALLRKSFLFRPRGLFYRPGVGDARSYVLAGRL